MSTSSSADLPASPSLASTRPSVLSAQSLNSPKRKRRGRAKRPPRHPPRGGRPSPSNDAATENCPPREASERLLQRSSCRDGGRRSQSSGPPAKRAKSNRAGAVNSECRATERGRDDAAPGALREDIHDGEDERYRSVRVGKRNGEDAEFVAGGVDHGDPAEENAGVPSAGGGRKRYDNIEVEDTHADGENTHDNDNDAGADKAPLPNNGTLPAPQKIADVEKAVRRLFKLLHIDEMIESARSEGAREEEEYYSELKEILEQELRRVYAEGTYDNIFHNLQRLTSSHKDPGLYILYLSISKLLIKIGMSAAKEGKMKRAKQQPHKAAFNLCDLPKVNELCPADSNVVKAIENLLPPGLQFHEDKAGKRTMIIQLQVVEAIANSMFETRTGTVGERLTQMPSQFIQQITTLRPADSFSAEDTSFVLGRNLRFFLTWGTYKSFIYNLREIAGDDVVTHILGDQPYTFLHLYMLICAFGEDNVQEFTNAIDCEESPRTKQMMALIEELKPHLLAAQEQLRNAGSISEDTKREIRRLIATITEEAGDYGHYKEPSDEELVQAAVPKLRSIVEEVAGSGDVIVLERTLYNALKQKKNKEAFDELFPRANESGVEMIEGTNYLRRLTCTMHDGREVRYLVIRSLFKLFSEQTTPKGRVNLAESYLGLLGYLSAAGVRARGDAEREASILRSFLMEWQGLDGDISLKEPEATGSVRDARNHHVGEGIAVGGIPKNVGPVSCSVLRIGYLETLHLRSSLGRELFDVLMNAFDVVAGPEHPTSLEKEFSASEAARAKRQADSELLVRRAADGDEALSPDELERAKKVEDERKRQNEAARAKRQEDNKLLQRRASGGDEALSPDELEHAKRVEDQRQTKREQDNEAARAKRRADNKLLQRRATGGDEALLPDELEQVKKIEDQRQRKNEKCRTKSDSSCAHYVATGFCYVLAKEKGFPEGWSAKKTRGWQFMDPSGTIIYPSGVRAARKALLAYKK